MAALEVINLESTVYADYDGEIAEVLVKAKECVEARDLLVVYK